MSKLQKLIIVFSIGFCFKLFFSCNPYHSEPIEINYNHVHAVGIDNSDRYTEFYSSTDTLYTEAVAFKLILSDTTMHHTSFVTRNIMQLFSITPAVAHDISLLYIPKAKVTAINIKTLHDMGQEIKAGDDVTDYFLCYNPMSYSDLYNDLNQGVSWLNEPQPNEQVSLALILKQAVKNSNAQFEIVITLENGNELLCSTNNFTIIGL